MVLDDCFLPLKYLKFERIFLKPIYSHLSLRHVVFFFSLKEMGERL